MLSASLLSISSSPDCPTCPTIKKIVTLLMNPARAVDL